jgi:TolB-like protein
MPHDIFISYSTKDRIDALALVERLRSSGYTIWIDQSGIDAATSWSKEIAEALEDCSTFILLLSPNSLASENVAKELAVAAELKKHIIPIELESVQLKREFLYHLTGLQRVAHTNIDAIVHVLDKYRGSGQLPVAGDQSVLTDVTNSELNTQNSKLLRIAVLPFEDQSPQHDNEWFSDGLTDELISTLGKLDELFVVDSQSSKIYKGAKLQTKDIASQLRVRYIVHGAVRKAGDKIRIQATLIDTQDGATLWDEKFSGTMEDIFEIQEKTALDITRGLKLKLTKEEVAEIEDRGTENAEAYELYLRGLAVTGYSPEDNFHSIDLYKQAIALDPNFTQAYAGIAVAYANYYRIHGRKPEILELQREAAEKAAALSPEHPKTYNALANLYMNLGEKEKAIETAKKMVTAAPKRSRSYSVVGFMYQASGKFVEAAKWYEQALSIDSGSLNDHNNLMVCYYFLHDMESVRKAVIRAIPHYEQYLALHPDDQGIRVNYMISLEGIDKHELSTRQAERLLAMPDVVGFSLYQAASVFSRQGKIDLAIESLKLAAEKGFVNADELRSDKDFFGPLHELPDFEKLVAELEAIMIKNNG